MGKPLRIAYDSNEQFSLIGITKYLNKMFKWQRVKLDVDSTWNNFKNK